MRFLLIVSLLGLVQACGKSDSNAGLPKSKERMEVLPLDGSNVQGIYLAKFTTLNPHINGTIPGSATVMRTEDKFYAYVRIFAGGVKAWHQQNVYVGNRCPDMRDDLNQDGIIDVEEARKVLGEVLIPLDSNINTQTAGKNIYPLGDASGSYYYERIGSFDKMFNDLKNIDKDLEDGIAKLAIDDGLRIEGKAVMIQGVAESVVLPETVATLGRYKSFQTLPITCGVFTKVTKNPGQLDDGRIPGPIGEVGPTPTPEDPTTPAPTPTPTPSPTPAPEYEEDEPEDRWVDRVLDWWRRRWSEGRGDRRDSWGDGDREREAE